MEVRHFRIRGLLFRRTTAEQQEGNSTRTSGSRKEATSPAAILLFPFVPAAVVH